MSCQAALLDLRELCSCKGALWYAFPQTQSSMVTVTFCLKTMVETMVEKYTENFRVTNTKLVKDMIDLIACAEGGALGQLGK